MAGTGSTKPSTPRAPKEEVAAECVAPQVLANGALAKEKEECAVTAHSPRPLLAKMPRRLHEPNPLSP